MCCVVVEEGNAELEVVVLSQQLVSVEVEVGLREVEVEWVCCRWWQRRKVRFVVRGSICWVLGEKVNWLLGLMQAKH